MFDSFAQKLSMELCQSGLSKRFAKPLLLIEPGVRIFLVP